MDGDSLPPAGAPPARPSFTSFWKRTKDAAASAVSASKQVSFVPVSMPRIAKKRNVRKQAAPSNDGNSNMSPSQDASLSSSSSQPGGATGTRRQATDNKDSGSRPGTRDTGDAVSSTAETQRQTAQEKAQARRAQVRRAQIKHRQRKADYMRQLEIDIDTLRDLIDVAEQEAHATRKENAALRRQLGPVALGQSQAPNSKTAKGKGKEEEEEENEATRSLNVGLDLTDVTMADIPSLRITPAPPLTMTPISYTVDSVAASLSPPSLSAAATSAVTASGSSPFTSAATMSPTWTIGSGSSSGTGDIAFDKMSFDSADGINVSDDVASTRYTASLFHGIDLDSIDVSVVIDEAIGNPVYHISSPNPSIGSSSHVDNLMVSGMDCIPGPPVSPFDAGFVPTFETELAVAPLPTPASSTIGIHDQSPSPLSTVLPHLTISETHQVVNFILALEHVCWGHASHQYHDIHAPMRADCGHSMMATSLFLREAPESVFLTIESTAKDMAAYTTNTEPDNDEVTAQHISKHIAAEGLTWQAPDITLQTLYGLAASLNPVSELELTPIQAWFELVARYPLAILLRQDVMDELKRQLVGVVRCLCFGAVMDRDAFESVVQRVLDPVMAAEEAKEKAAAEEDARALI